MPDQAPLEPKQEKPRWWARMLEGAQHSYTYPLVVCMLAAISAGSGLYPFGPVLVAALIIAPRRWLGIYLASCLGAVIGVLFLAGMMEVYGHAAIDEMFPELDQRSDWLRYSHWISRYGWIALMVFAALPIPQMPVLLLSALSQVGLPQIAFAVFVGKLVKYGIYMAVTLAALKEIEARKK
jgi:membrane protein YqaA with SNARE-associated domain